jgi:hypothetical protein
MLIAEAKCDIRKRRVVEESLVKGLSSIRCCRYERESGKRSVAGVGRLLGVTVVHVEERGVGFGRREVV